MLNSLDTKLIDHFIKELSIDDTWRIYRQDTFLDLINVDLNNYLLNPNNEILLTVFNNCLKSQISSKIILSSDINYDLTKFGKDFIFLKAEYEFLFDEINKLSLNGILKFDNIFDVTNYIKVLSSMEIKNYSIEVFNEIALLILKVLKNEPDTCY